MNCSSFDGNLLEELFVFVFSFSICSACFLCNSCCSFNCCCLFISSSSFSFLFLSISSCSFLFCSAILSLSCCSNLLWFSIVLRSVSFNSVIVLKNSSYSLGTLTSHSLLLNINIWFPLKYHYRNIPNSLISWWYRNFCISRWYKRFCWR